MKRLICIILTALLCISVCGCSELLKGVETDYPAAIMVEGEVYLKSGSPMPAEVDPSAIIGYTDSYTDTFPKKDGETNFNRELDMPYARVEGGIAVLYENEWYLCTPMNEDAKPVESNKVYGRAVFYDGPVKEAQASKHAITVGHSIELTQEQADKLKAVVDNVNEWTDDHMVDRLAYWFDGHFELADREFEYYFTYQYNVIYYDHYFAEIPEEDMDYIRGLSAELPESSDEPKEQPPALRVSGGSETITALRGTSSWHYLNADGTSTGIESDSVHPLEAKQYMPGLNTTGERVDLFFEILPDEVTAVCWDISRWSNTEKALKMMGKKAETVSADKDSLTLLPGGHIYEITAKWDGLEYGGTARYSFYTSPLGIELTAKDITPTGLTLVCTQSGGDPDGELMTGAAFRLQTYNEELDFWEDMPTKNELIFTSEAWQIPMNSSVEWKTDWELYYGELLSGRYRIFKEIMDFRRTGDFDLYNYYAEFTID